MGKRLVIAEKPMLAKAILDAIPGTAKSIKAGERVFYTEKGDYLVVALAGHVLQLKEPEDYDPKYKKWTLEDLPIFFPVPFPVSWTVRNTGYFPTESLEPSGNRLFSRSALNEGDLFRGSL